MQRILPSLVVLAGCVAGCRYVPDEAEPGVAERPAERPHSEPTSAPVQREELDDDMRAVLEELADLGGKPIETLSGKEARRQPTPADAVERLLAQRGGAPEFPGTIRELTLPGPAGEIAARVYTPSGAGPFPLILYIHGGGWVIADLDTYDASARALCSGSSAVVLSTHYRQAPEFAFPAAHDDVFAAYRWAVVHADELDADAERMAVAGESAGGNMALAVSLMAREDGLKLPRHQLLVYPVASTSLDWPSVEQHAQAKPLDKAMLPWFLDQYAPHPADRMDPRLDLLSADLRGLPPTTVITAEIDPLRSEGAALAERLEAAGVPVEHRDYRGVTHEFFGMGAVVADAAEAQRFACERLAQAFAQVRP